MSQATRARWERMKDRDSREVERLLREAFPDTDAYRYNSASIRVRVVDSRFEGKSLDERDTMVETYIHRLPTEIQRDIMFLLTLAPGEGETSVREGLLNLEFEDPGPSLL